MDQLPKDPFMLVSFLNMKLRDEYDTPDKLCEGMDMDIEDFNLYLKSKGISYFGEGNRFVID